MPRKADIVLVLCQYLIPESPLVCCSSWLSSVSAESLRETWVAARQEERMRIWRMLNRRSHHAAGGGTRNGEGRDGGQEGDAMEPEMERDQ